MFVEVTRLFTVVLLTAAGFIIGKDLAPNKRGALRHRRHARLPGRLSLRWRARSIPRARGRGSSNGTVDRVPLPQVMAGLVGGGVGAVFGLTIAVPLALLVRPVAISIGIGGLLVWLAMYFGYRLASRKSEELFAMAGLSTRPLVRARPYDDLDGFIVDSSAVMDGQLLPLTRSGLFRDDLYVPRFVLDELQGMADANDERSRRAHRGLEILEVLRRETPLRVLVIDDEVPELDEVDAKLVMLARKLQLRLLTNDVNLAKVAEIQGVPTVIPRRLAADLIPGVLAGETLTVALTRPGRHPGQGVGFLDDGSMVVVNGGEDLIDSGPVTLVVSSIVPDQRRPDGLRAPDRSPHRTGDPRPERVRATLVAPVLSGADLGDRRCGRVRVRASAARSSFTRSGRSASWTGRCARRRGAVTAWCSSCHRARRRDGPPVVDVVPGGATRAASVRAGLAAVPSSAEIVLVHDAARPLAGDDLFRSVIDAVAAGADGAIPGLAVADTIKRVADHPWSS